MSPKLVESKHRELRLVFSPKFCIVSVLCGRLPYEVSEIRSSEYILFSEVSCQLAEMLRKTIKKPKKWTPRPSKFIANSSPPGNKAGMKEHDVKQHGDIVPLRK
jgi:hypothetical protein